nr:MAG TPA: hypothetical protein [Caudoviricetes sp.]
MRHLLYILALIMLLASCRTTRTITRNSEVDVRQRDSLVVRDSVVLRYVTATRDSVTIRDSVVLVKDSSGRVIATERYRTSERTRDTHADNSATATRDRTHDKDISSLRQERLTDSKSGWPTLGTIMDIVGWIAFVSFLILFVSKLWRRR